MKKLRYFLEYLLVKLWLWAIPQLGLAKATNFASKFFQIIGMRLKPSRTAFDNLTSIFPELDIEQKKKIILGVWSNLGMVASETSILMSMKQEEFNNHIQLNGLEHLNAIRGKKAIFFMAHLANWEIIGKALAPHNIKFNAVYRAANNKLVDQLINDIRHNSEVNLIPKGKSGAKQLIQALQNNQHLMMLVDQKMNDGIKVPFLGRDAMTAPAIATLAIKYDCPIIPIQIIRKNNSNFEIIIHPIMEYKEKTPEAIMLQINEQIGNWVKENPEQWFWLHNRWIK